MPAWPEPTKIRLPERIGAAGHAIAPIDLSVHVAGSGPAVLLAHGFPELAYSWRHQVEPLVEAGYTVIVPDQRGYGASHVPEAIDEYDMEHLTADLVGILDHLGIARAVFVGHDWGGFVTWSMPVLYPDRCAGVIGVNTPNVALPGTDVLRLVFDDPEKMYMLWFQEPGVAEVVMDARVRCCFDLIMRRAVEPDRASLADMRDGMDANPFRRLDEIEPSGEPLLDENELETYVRTFEATGFRGGINWYRNLDRNRELFPDVGAKCLALPCLMVTAEWDLALPPSAAEGMPALCPDLETHMIERCGHWTQQEHPERLNAIMIDWLERRFR